MANEKKESLGKGIVKTFTNGLIFENPTFVLMLGMCPTLAVTSSAINGMGMGLTTMVVLTLSNIIISYEEVEDKIKEFIDINSVNLKTKILYSHLELGNIDKINDLRKYVQKTKIEKIVVQIGSNNNILLNSCEYNENEKNRIELESLYYIMTKQPYNLLIKDKIIKNLRRYFKKNKEKIVICRPYFSSFDL